MTASSEILWVCPTAKGHLIRIFGRASFRESRAFSEFIDALLSRQTGEVAVDLMECQHLDSTFLGCLLMLSKTHGESNPPRIRIIAPKACAKRLFASTGLDSIINFTDCCPEPSGKLRAIPIPEFDIRRGGEHMMEAHQNLADVVTFDAKQFSDVANRVAAELEKLTGRA